jgi:tetratricopeptide (TPR) repeat protein
MEALQPACHPIRHAARDQDIRMNSIESILRDLSRFWQLPVPAAMARLYLSTRVTELGPCVFFPPDELLSVEVRWRGMLPQFLPFGSDGEDNLYGLYAAPGRNRRDYPVLWWNHEYDHYLPIASEFEAFLRSCVVTGQYLAQDAVDEDHLSEQEISRRVKQLSLPADLMEHTPPRNQRELSERLAREDPQNALALAELGSMELARGEFQRARDFLVRASEAAPAFSDPYFLLGETYRVEKNESRACELWWKVFDSPVAFCSRTATYGLCHADEDGEIYQVAAERAQECRDYLAPTLQSSPLWKLLLTGDPFDSASRLELGRTFSRQGDPAAAEREYLNALTLATETDELDEAYEALILFYEAAGRERDAALCRFDAGLPDDDE